MQLRKFCVLLVLFALTVGLLPAVGTQSSLAADRPPAAPEQPEAATPAAQADDGVTLAANDGSDPLANNYDIAPSSDIFMAWAEDFNEGTAYQKIYEVVPNPNTPPLYLLDPANRQDETGANGAYGEQWVSSSTGDFNGDGFDDVVVAWEGENDSVRLLVPQINPETLDWSQATRLTAGGPLAGTLIQTVAGDFDGDGQAEFALAYQTTNNRLRIELYDTDGTLTPQRRATLSDVQLPANANLAKFDLVAGNFDGDANNDDELALVGFNADKTVYVKLYDVTGTGSASLVARGSTTISVAPNLTKDFGAQIVATAGDFDQAPNNIREEIAVGFSYYLGEDIFNQSADTYLYLLRTNANLDNPTFDESKRLANQRGNENYPIPLDLAAGDMNKDGRAEIAFAEGFNVNIYTVANDLALTQRASVSYSPFRDDVAYQYSDDFIGIADINSDRAAELVIGYNRVDNNGGDGPDAVHTLIYEVYAARLSNTNGIQGLDKVAEREDEQVAIQQFNQGRTYSLALGDFDGDGFRLGTPTYYQATDIVQPLVILNAPPNHFDIFDSNGNAFDGPPYPAEAYRDINNCYNLPRLFFTSCAFAARYIRSESSVVGVTTQVTRDWSVSAGVSVDIKGIFEAGLKSTYGEKFSRVEGTSTEIAISEAVTARTEDQIYATVIDYDVWEYPIYASDGTTPEGTLLVVSPKRIEDRWFSTKSFSAITLETQHEVGNLLSYAEDIPSNPDVLEAFHSASTYDLSSSEREWTLTINQFRENRVDTERSIGLEANASLGFKGLGLELNGTYDRSDLNTHQTSVQDSLQIQVELDGLNLSIGNVRYLVRPYAYWSQNGPLVVDYAVRLETAPPGQPRTWWDIHYNNLPDPAFKMPWRYDPEKGYALSDPRQRILNWEIIADPRSPAVGEQTTLQVPVYNYSLVPVSNVKVHFYQGDPDSGGTLIGETTTGTLPPRGKEIVSVPWTVPQNVSRFASIYVVIDPDNTLSEIHKNNNKSFNTLVLGCADCAPADLSLVSADVGYVPDTPTVGDLVQLSATVAANRDAANVQVSFFRGDPSQGNRIGDATILEIKANGTANASVNWDTRGLAPGEYTIWVVVAEQQGEPDTTNNRASQTITLQSGGTRVYLPLVIR